MGSNKQEKEEWLLDKGVKYLYNTSCRLYKRAKLVLDDVFGMGDLNEDTKPDLKLVKLKVGDEKIFYEQQLMENRSGLTLGVDTKRGPD